MLYALEYINLLDFPDKVDTPQKQVIRDYLVNGMDVDVLYTSGLWERTMDCIVQLYTKDDSLQKDFSRDMQSLGKRIDSPAAYRAFTDYLDTATYTNGSQSREIKERVSGMKKDQRYSNK